VRVYVCPKCGGRNLWEGISPPKQCEFCNYEFGKPIGGENGARGDIEVSKGERRAGRNGR